MTALKVTSIGNQVGVIFPPEFVVRFHVRPGDDLVAIESGASHDKKQLAIVDLSRYVDSFRSSVEKLMREVSGQFGDDLIKNFSTDEKKETIELSLAARRNFKQRIQSMLAQLQEQVELDLQPGRIPKRSVDSETSIQLQLAEQIMDEDREVLRRLAE